MENVVERLNEICRETGVCEGGTMDREQEKFAEYIANKAALQASATTGQKVAEQVTKEVSELIEEKLSHQSPISPRCTRVLGEAPLCYDFSGIRSYVMCRAWAIMEKEKRTRLPVGEAWAEARKICRMT